MSKFNIPESPEAIAYKLMLDLFAIAGKSIEQVTKEELIGTFANCLELVRNPDKHLPQKKQNTQTYPSDRPTFF